MFVARRRVALQGVMPRPLEFVMIPTLVSLQETHCNVDGRVENEFDYILILPSLN